MEFTGFLRNEKVTQSHVTDSCALHGQMGAFGYSFENIISQNFFLKNQILYLISYICLSAWFSVAALQVIN